MSRKVLLFVVVIFAIFSFNICLADQLKDALDNLALYQAGDGGINDELLKPSQQNAAKGNLESTKLGVFLAAVYNKFDQLTLPGIGEFLKDLSRQDGGFSTEETSDIISTRDALLVYHFIGVKIPNPQDVLAFIRSLYDEKSGLYGRTVGADGDLESTVAAYQIFTTLGTLKNAFVTANFPKINELLKESVVDTADETFFSFPAFKDIPAITANAYGIFLGSITDFNFENAEKYVQYFVSLQKPSGGFSSSNDDRGNYKNTQEALYSIGVLSTLSKFDFFEKVNLETLESFIDSAGPSLNDIAYAQQAAVATGLIDKHFKTELILETENGQELQGGLIEGARFVPSVRIVGHEGLAANRFLVDINTQFGKEADKYQLTYSKDKSKYIATSAAFDTGKNLGEIQFAVLARFQLATVGAISLDFTESRTVGYKVNIESKAYLESAGKDVQVGDSVSIGTFFTFQLSLERENNEKATFDKFDAHFSVVDSSGSIIESQKQEDSESETVTFRYTLDKVNIPPGRLSFHFDISNDQVGTHSRGKVSYELSTTLVASEIYFGKSRQAGLYKIGDKVEVKMVPASFDLSNTHQLDQTDIEGNAIQRDFYMDVVSAGTRVHSIKGTKVDKAYQFSLSLVPRLDNFGTNTISFRYLTKYGESIELRPFDSENNELFDDLAQLSFSVPSDLRLFELQEFPKSQELSYGNNVEFRFKVKDNNSGEIIKAGSSGSNVYLSLVHEDDNGKTFTSVSKFASHSQDFFEIDFQITPNAVGGPATIIIYAQGLNGQRLEILDENGNPISYKVTIGGEIEVSKNTYSSSLTEADKTSVIATFALSCNGNALRDAQLLATFTRSDGSIIESNVQVASHKDDYQVSLSFPHSQLPDGSYQFNFYRDLSRAGNQQSGSADKPLFVIPLSHQGSGSSSLPFSPQVVITTLILVGFGAIFIKRNKIIQNQ